MPVARDLTGLRVGQLTAVRLSEQRSRGGRRLWECLCDCGRTSLVDVTNLTGKRPVKSCGCQQHEHNRTHGMSRTPTFNTWVKMLQRCRNPRDRNYYKYGARGIFVCDRWSSFENFVADMGERPRGKTLDRVNNNDGYYKDNCRWATPKQQARNTRTNVLNESIVAEIRALRSAGVSFAEIGERFGIHRSSARKICLGLAWSAEAA